MRQKPEKPAIARMVLLCLASLALFGAVVSAQSGRKQKRPESQPPVQGVNQPDARVTPEPEAEPPKPKDTGPAVIVASEMTDIGIPNFYTDIARKACIAELRDAHLQDIQEAKDLNRADATKKAKDGEVFVILLELRQDTMTSSSYSRYNFELRYTLYEPKTGKVINIGAGYPARDSRVPTPPNTYDYDQRLVELMGRDAGRKAAKFIVERGGSKTPLMTSNERPALTAIPDRVRGL